jgi:hypothetical protein
MSELKKDAKPARLEFNTIPGYPNVRTGTEKFMLPLNFMYPLNDALQDMEVSRGRHREIKRRSIPPKCVVKKKKINKNKNKNKK